MRTKDEYTVAFIENDPRESKLGFLEAYNLWWQNQRRDGGFRLHARGYKHCITTLKLEHYSIDLEDVSMTSRFLLDLDRFIKTPYYIKNVNKKDKSIILFDKKTYFALTMYNNDFEKFINAHKV